MSATVKLHIFFRSHDETDFIHSCMDIPEDEVSDVFAKTTNELMEMAVRHEFTHTGGAYYMEKPEPEWTAAHQIADNITHGYDLITAFIGDVQIIQ